MKFDKKFFLLMAILAIIYLAIIIVFPKDTFWVVDGGAKLIYTKSLIQNNFKDISLIYPGEQFDPYFADNPISVRFMKLQNDKMYSVYPLWFPLFTAFLVKLLGNFGLYIIPFLSGLSLLFVTYQITKILLPNFSRLAVLLTGLATPVFFFSVVFWEHTWSAFLVLLAFFCYLKYFNQTHKKWLIASGLFVGFSFWVRAELAALFMGMFIAHLIFAQEKKQALFYLLGFVIGIAPHLLIQWILLGNPLGFHVAENLKLSQIFASTDNIATAFLKERIEMFHALLFQTSGNRQLSWFIAIPFLIFIIVSFIPKLRKQDWLTGTLLVLSAAGSLAGLTIKFLSKNPVYDSLFFSNFFVGTPLILFGLIIYRFADRKDKFFSFIFTSIGLFILLFLLISPLNGGMQWGSRFLLPFYPILTIFAVYTIAHILLLDDAIKKKFFIGLFMVAVLISFVDELRGIEALYYKKKGSQNLIRETKKLEPKNVITDVWWYPLDVASVYFEKNMFYPRKNDGLNDITLSKLIIDLMDANYNDFSFVAFSNKYEMYQPFLNKLPVQIQEKKIFKEKNLGFMDLYLAKYHIQSVDEMNRGTYAEMCNRVGDFLCRDNFYEDGIIYFKKSLEVHPEGNQMAHFLMGQAYIRLDNWVMGLRELDRALFLMPDNKVFQEAWKEANDMYQAGLPPKERKKGY